MNLILDEGLPLRAAALLREQGLETQHVLELGMAGQPDAAVLDVAKRAGAVAATLDADFHQILATTGAVGPSAIRIRIEGLSGAQVAILLRWVVGSVGPDLTAGALVTVDAVRVRVRKLPIPR